MLAIGFGNFLSAMIGGLPMISEIVRSRANIDSGARTRFANLFHGMFLLVCVALIPAVIHRIPLAALAAMLIYTGYRLANPAEFVHIFKVGPEQLLIYVATIIGVLATDLLIGIGIGIGVKLAIHFVNGLSVRSIFTPLVEVIDEPDGSCRICASDAAVFSNWIPFRRQISNVGLRAGKNVSVDLSQTRLVDHTVMAKLHELQRDFERQGLQLNITGLEEHKSFSKHPKAARKRKRPLAGVS